ncbi:hypothetical protein C8A05DRAFT_37929, partial [Staphylotrichum tortipilum]
MAGEKQPGFDGHPYTYILGGRTESGRPRYVSDFDPPPTRDFAGLLRCCRALAVETAALLYSANRFVIFYSSRHDSFKRLRALSPTSIASLTNLKIVLNESCPEPTDPSSHSHCWCSGHTEDDWDANHHCAKDAQFVFFSRNRFIVHDFHAWHPWNLPAVQREPSTPDTASTSTSSRKYYPFDRLAASEFLRDIVPVHCLAYLRFLELVFPPYVPHGWPDRQHPA